MSERNIIAIHEQQSASNNPTAGARAAAIPRLPDMLSPPTGTLEDRRGRQLHDLRISVTDRCNFRCSYCMPKEVFDKNYPFLPHSALLSFEEIVRVAHAFLRHGVRKIRLTGGEPLLRKNLDILIAQLAELRCLDGSTPDLTLTTNGSLLARKAASLKASGLRRVTVSLDGMDDRVFRRMNDVDFPVAEVLKGIETALAVGLGPIKVNMVVKRGTNEQEILPMARFFRENYGSHVILRFIEYMDVGCTNGWQMDQVMPSDEVRQWLHEHHPLELLAAAQPGETAQRWRYQDGKGEVGFISSVTQAFCRDCNRARLSTEGQLYLCLFAQQGHDLRHFLRQSHPSGRPYSDDEIAAAIAEVWQGRQDRYSELRAAATALQSPLGETTPQNATGQRRRIEMSYIGG